MSPKPLDSVKKGFTILSKQIQNQKAELTAKLSRNETISSADEHWLDNEGNLIDEQQVLESLESAPDYEKAVEQLDEGGKKIVQKLLELAGYLPKVAGAKRKRT